ncbi:MAG: hypothetical protein K6T78_06690 [Alicyclobacillus sp.]|nr:hypothetical protein [Alicyclobacillus sp.]
MKRRISNAAFTAYIGAVLLILAYIPGLDAVMDSVRLLHALWHVDIVIGAGLLVYGVETLRRRARQRRVL